MIASDVPIPAPRMSPQDRQDWIVAYIMARSIGTPFQSTFIDCLHADFIDDYCAVTGIEPHYMILGAHKCPQAARDLKALHELGILHRHRSGVEGMGYGWPKWVWSYSVSKDNEKLCRMVAESFRARCPNVRVL